MSVEMPTLKWGLRTRIIGSFILLMALPLALLSFSVQHAIQDTLPHIASQQVVEHVFQEFLVVGALSSVLVFYALGRVARHIAEPLEFLTASVRRAARGERGVVFELDRADEIGQLSARFQQLMVLTEEREQQERQLRAYYEQILHAMPLGVVVRRGGAVVFSNHVTPEQLLEEVEIHTLKPGDRRTISHNDRCYDVTVSPLPHDDQVLMSILDITEQVKLSEALRRTERLATAGEMAAGVVHAVNNPLDGVRRAIVLADRLPPGDERWAEMLDIIREGTDRIAEVTNSLLGYARSTDTGPAVACSANELVRSAETLARLRAQELNVRLQLDLDARDPRLLVHPHAVRDALVNLMMNGIDACEAGQLVRIETLQTSADQVQIIVEDNGHGISPEDLPRVFEPFFSTKEPGHGTGLGLTMARRLLEDHEGTVTVSSHGGGTRFVITLPTLLRSVG